MKRQVSIILITLLIINLFGVSTVWAKSKAKDFLPYGLAKQLEKGKTLPPAFQERFQERFEEGFYEKIRGVIEGKIVLKKEVDNQQWIVIQGEDCLKTFKLDVDDKYSVGDMVKVQYVFDKIISIKHISEDDDDDDDDEDISAEDLTYLLSVSPNNIEVGEEVTFKLMVKNETEEDITTWFTSGQRYDFIVKKDGKKVWQWSDNYNFITVTQKISIDSNETISYSEQWKPKQTGKYTVEAYFMGESKTKPVARKVFYVKGENKDETNLSYKLDVVKGEPNLLILKVTNSLNKNSYVTIPSGQIFDFLVSKDGEKVWKWSDGKVFTQAVQKLHFAPHETKVYYAQFFSDKEGKYKVYAYFKGAEKDDLVAGPVTFTK